MQLIIKKFLIIFFLLNLVFLTNNTYSTPKPEKDYGIISIMYHRFDENKYPSTNIKLSDFQEHIKIIQENKIEFINELAKFIPTSAQ